MNVYEPPEFVMHGSRLQSRIQQRTRVDGINLPSFDSIPEHLLWDGEVFVPGDLLAAQTDNLFLPKNLVVQGHLTLPRGIPIIMPRRLHVGGDLDGFHLNAEKMPDELQVGGDLYLRNAQVHDLPRELVVGNILDMKDSIISRIPEGLTVGGNMLMNKTPLVHLPEHLIVGGCLDLSHTPITTLPCGLRVGGTLILYKSGVQTLPEDMTVAGRIGPSEALLEIQRFGGRIAPGTSIVLTLSGSRHAMMETRERLAEFPDLLRVLEANTQALPGISLNPEKHATITIARPHQGPCMIYLGP